MENFEKKYNEALERMKSWAKGEHPECFSEAQKAAEFIFPELKESEDDRIVRCLLNYFNHVRYNGLDLKGTDVDEVIAWLEKQCEKSVNIDIESMVSSYKQRLSQGGIKNNPLVNICLTAFRHGVENVLEELNLKKFEKQGEKVTNINGEDWGIDGLYHAINILEKTLGRVGGYQSDDGILEHKAAINAVKELYKKQYAQKHFSDFNANDWYVSKVDGKIHNMKYNPTDKVKPKFKVGDWCIDKQDGTIFCIENVTENTYDYKTDKGNSYSCTHGSLELDSRLWTIADAKDGDVLAINWHEDDDSWEKIIIFKKYHNKGVKGLYSAPCVEGYGNTFKNGKLAYPEEVPYYSETWTANLHPATKEQRDLLFQKIADAGCYEWDAEKKELKKIIEPKTLDTDKVIGWIVANIYNFEYYVKRFKEDFGL